MGLLQALFADSGRPRPVDDPRLVQYQAKARADEITIASLRRENRELRAQVDALRVDLADAWAQADAVRSEPTTCLWFAAMADGQVIDQWLEPLTEDMSDTGNRPALLAWLDTVLTPDEWADGAIRSGGMEQPTIARDEYTWFRCDETAEGVGHPHVSHTGITNEPHPHHRPLYTRKENPDD